MAPQLGDQLDELNSLFSRFNLPPGGQYDGWYQYFDRDIRDLLGMKIKPPFENSYCGNGKLKACQKAIWNAIAASGSELQAKHGTADPSLWRSDANRERISLRARPARHDDALRQSPERDPAGDLVRRSPLSR